VKDECAYLLHAIDAIDAIQSYTVDGREAFFRLGSCGKQRTAKARAIAFEPTIFGCSGLR
jgi:hypothetical protein